MSQSQTCIRKLRASPLQNIIATSGESFICVGYNHPKERQVPQDRFCHCWKNNSADEHGHWDRTRAEQARHWFQAEVRDGLLSALGREPQKGLMTSLGDRVAQGDLSPEAAAAEMLRLLGRPA